MCGASWKLIKKQYCKLFYMNKTVERDFEKFSKIEQRLRSIAVCSVNGSTLRKIVSKGDIRKIREFLLKLEVEKLSRYTKNQELFKKKLDYLTKKLSQKLTVNNSVTNKPSNLWGAARKVLNIYFKLCNQDIVVHDSCGFDNIESVLEVPLDGYSMNFIKTEYEIIFSKGAWEQKKVRVIDVDAKVNEYFQEAAQKIVDFKNTSIKQSNLKLVRVDLDYYAYRNDMMRQVSRS